MKWNIFDGQIIIQDIIHLDTVFAKHKIVVNGATTEYVRYVK